MAIIQLPNTKPDFEAVYDAWYDRVYKYAYTLLMIPDPNSLLKA